MGNKKLPGMSFSDNFTLSIHNYLKQRELGLHNKTGIQNVINSQIYSNLDKVELLDNTKSGQERKFGAIFNLEFSLDGRLLVAACEEKSIILYDASNQRCIRTISGAHSNCVNCVRFLDDHNFATCSDDTLIKLWDLRNLRKETRTLRGHSNWVKNIEFSYIDNTMVTSAFDGNIYTWNIHSDYEFNQPYDAVFLMNGIMRTKLSPDCTKLIISTTSGYIIIIHDLNLATLANDLRNFKPNLYRLMQQTDQNFPAGNIHNYLFHPRRTRNRVEFIDDFPNNAELISSLQIHPHGWSALSRNINSEESEDWTSVHDIQMRDPSEYELYSYVTENIQLSGDDEATGNRRPTDLWVGYLTNEQYSNDSSSNSLRGPDRLPVSSITSGLIGKNSYRSLLQNYPESQNKIVRNLKRLTHYIKENNSGKGYIKEVCFSPDGRVICSPFNKGIRILGFSKTAQELPYCLSDKPEELCTLLELNTHHKDVVVCCKFNPVHKMELVSGCLGGDIVWYKPAI